MTGYNSRSGFSKRRQRRLAQQIGDTAAALSERYGGRRYVFNDDADPDDALPLRSIYTRGYRRGHGMGRLGIGDKITDGLLARSVTSGVTNAISSKMGIGRFSLPGLALEYGVGAPLRSTFPGATKAIRGAMHGVKEVTPHIVRRGYGKVKRALPGMGARAAALLEAVRNRGRA